MHIKDRCEGKLLLIKEGQVGFYKQKMVSNGRQNRWKERRRLDLCIRRHVLDGCSWSHFGRFARVSCGGGLANSFDTVLIGRVTAGKSVITKCKG